MNIKTIDERFSLEFATVEDVGLVLDFIKQLAIYEDMLDDVVATEESLIDSLFNKKVAEVIIGYYDEKPVAFVLFFHNYSTFLGKTGLYIEDLFVVPSMRGKGLGKILLAYIAKLAKERDCGRVEWWCLNWNEPSIEFYKKMGAIPMDEWTVFRLTGDKLDILTNDSI